MHHIAIFASGSGTNALKIIEHFQAASTAKVALVVCNKRDAGVLDIARRHTIPSVVISKQDLNNPQQILPLLSAHQIDFIVLAGFLLLIPDFLIQQYNKRIVNIHPALLPKYGGKGMYGKFVHEAVFQNKEHTTGITIHYASENYDEGDIIFQASTTLSETDTPESIAQKVQQLEHEHFAPVIEKLLTD